MNTLMKTIFGAASIISGSMIVFIFIFITSKGVGVFFNYDINIFSFLSGLKWSPGEGIYGVLFIFINTIIVSLGSIILSFPISVLTALVIVKMTPKVISSFLTVIIDILAAIPSIVYGVFASGVVVQIINDLANKFGYASFGGHSMLAAMIVLSIMILPTITSLSIVALKAVPKELEWGSLALGASKVQTNFKIVIKSASSGIYMALILGLSRSLGEATAVSMVAGNKMTGPTFNPFDITRTLTSTMLSGLKETTGLDYDIRFSVGIILLVTILVSNFFIHKVKRKASLDYGS